MSRIFLTLMLIAFVACNEQGAVKPTTPDFSKTDSIELYHYADPKDQKKFYRKFIADSHFINHVVQAVQVDSIQKKPCENDFKLFLYRKGEVYKTIYAATQDSCRYYAYVIDGITYFKPLSDSGVTMLNNQLPD